MIRMDARNMLVTVAVLLGTLAGVALALMGGLLLITYLDEGAMVALAWGAGLTVTGLLGTLTGSLSLLHRLGIVERSPRERARSMIT